MYKILPCVGCEVFSFPFFLPALFEPIGIVVRWDKKVCLQFRLTFWSVIMIPYPLATNGEFPQFYSGQLQLNLQNKRTNECIRLVEWMNSHTNSLKLFCHNLPVKFVLTVFILVVSHVCACAPIFSHGKLLPHPESTSQINWYKFFPLFKSWKKQMFSVVWCQIFHLDLIKCLQLLTHRSIFNATDLVDLQ